MSKSTFSHLSLLCFFFLSESSESFSPKLLSSRTLSAAVAPSTSSQIPRHAASSNSHNDSHEEDEEERRYQDWRRKQEEIEKKVRLQIKVDEEKEQEQTAMNSNMAYFDLSEEMLRVESIAPGLPLDSPERQVDDRVSQLEGELYAAVDHYEFPLAQQKTDEISQLHIDDCGAVLQVNSAYYRAFSEKNYTAMEHVWLHDASALCIHPSHKPLVGAPAVLDAWKGMFESSVGDFQRNWMEPTKIKLVVKGTTAIITCDEDVYARRFVRGQRRETELMNRLTATNIFRKVGDRWFMVHHHASWHANSEASRMAMTVSGGSGSKSPERSSIKGNKNAVVDGIMGTKDFGPYLGNMDKPQSPVKKIIMGGSLSDLLSGNIDDILSGGKSGDDSGAIIKITGNLGDLDDDEDDEDDDLDDDVEDVDEEVSSFVKELHMLREQNSKSSKSKKAASLSNSASAAGDPLSGNDGGGGSKDNIRQSCITALRKLSDQGSISQKQKRVLLTDIISCSARGEYSMVEVAYELLCGEGDDKDVAEEEFADQCRVFFESLS